MFYQKVNKKHSTIVKENIMLSNSTSNSSFLNGNIDGNFTDVDDRMTILDCDTRDNYHKPMSKMRKMAFSASILSMILVAIVFLLLPCNKNCVAKHHVTKFKKTINWMKDYEFIELKGKINTLKSSDFESSPLSLIFMYRNDKIFSNIDVKKSKQKSNGGIIRLNGNSGEIAWKNEMTNEPRSIDCTLIDCNKNGRNDCLVIDDHGQLACVDDTGHWIYYNSNSKTIKQEQEREEIYDFPLIIPDLTGDEVYEIMMVSYKSNATYLVLLSGSNGKLLAEEVQNCSHIHKLQIDADYIMKFICIVKDNIEQQMFKNLTDFYTLMTRKPKNKEIQPISSVRQHQYPNFNSAQNTQDIVMKVCDKELKIINKGTWPRESKTTIVITSVKNNIQKTHYNYSGNMMYAFTPVKFSVNMTASRGHDNENIHGFIIKLWIFNGTEVSYNFEKSKTKREVKIEKINKGVKLQRSNYTNQTYYNNAYKTKYRFLKESILLIVFNSTHIKAENTSQSNILQFCQNQVDSRNNEQTICQPDLKNQENSLVIADIDNDGSKEIVSYYSTFKNHDDKFPSNYWKLNSYVQLFKLETEIPKLYRGEYDMF